jgi:hypothetical protein
MRRTLAILTFTLFTISHARSQDELFHGSGPIKNLGGILIIRKDGVTTTSVGGVLFTRHVQVATETPDGLVVTRFTLPSVFHNPDGPPIHGLAPACFLVEVPDPDAMLYIDDQLVRTHGTSRLLESPPLPPVGPCTLHLRAVFRVGDNILIESKMLSIHAGERSVVKFDGSQALAVPVKANKAPEVLPFPSAK